MASRFRKSLKAVTQLDSIEIFNLVLYNCLLKIGVFRFLTPSKSPNRLLNDNVFQPVWFDFWPTIVEKGSKNTAAQKIIDRAEEILVGKFRMFGINLSEIELSQKIKLPHWSKSNSTFVGPENQDIKYIWEPARFSWAIGLAQAFYITKEDKYARFFWEKYSEFIKGNPLNKGPNWESAQEVSLRMIALIISINLIKDAESSTIERKIDLFRSIADHADRIPPTISYAKAQNNNHLVSEAVGLFTAGTFLPEHPRAHKWKRLGLKWFDHAVINQISNDGEYIQHSTNYHRMILTLAVWMNVLLQCNDQEMNTDVQQKLSFASKWLLGQLDPISGQVPNLGHNDGSLILPLCAASYNDYRPVIQVASCVFLGQSVLDPGPWDSLCYWLGVAVNAKRKNSLSLLTKAQTLRIGNSDAWATLRAARFTSRPAHADQLHVELWHRGYNIALDAGTFSYNAPPPWDNGLARTLVHNTLMLNGQDQMYRAGRFLWLDWAQSKVLDNTENIICAEQYGYKKPQAVHRRTLKRISNQEWDITDLVYSPHIIKKEFKNNLHWLLPDWPFQMTENTCTLSAPFGSVKLHISSDIKTTSFKLTLYKKGIPLAKDQKEEPLLGWYSPTYGHKLPALSLCYSINHKLPLTITSRFTFS